MLLSSCGHINKQLDLTPSKKVPIPVQEQQFTCTPDANVQLPSDEQLKAWSSYDTFVWGSNNYFWGDKCSQKLQDLKAYILCFNGDTKYCITPKQDANKE